jgi:hypothetical protein
MSESSPYGLRFPVPPEPKLSCPHRARGASVNTKLVKGEATPPKFEANHWRIKVSAGAQGKIEASW